MRMFMIAFLTITLLCSSCTDDDNDNSTSSELNDPAALYISSTGPEIAIGGGTTVISAIIVNGRGDTLGADYTITLEIISPGIVSERYFPI